MDCDNNAWEVICRRGQKQHQNRLLLSPAGWARFARDHFLEEGDECIFELVLQHQQHRQEEHNKTDNSSSCSVVLATFRVHIFRVLEIQNLSSKATTGSNPSSKDWSSFVSNGAPHVLIIIVIIVIIMNSSSNIPKASKQAPRNQPRIIKLQMVSKLKIPAKWTKGAAVQIITILSWTRNKFCNRLQWFLQQILWSKAGLLQQILEQTATSFCDWILTATNVVMELTLLRTLLQWVCVLQAAETSDLVSDMIELCWSRQIGDHPTWIESTTKVMGTDFL